MESSWSYEAVWRTAPKFKIVLDEVWFCWREDDDGEEAVLVVADPSSLQANDSCAPCARGPEIEVVPYADEVKLKQEEPRYSKIRSEARKKREVLLLFFVVLLPTQVATRLLDLMVSRLIVSQAFANN